MLAGRAGEPHGSSVGKGWRGIAVELFQASDVAFTSVFDNHNLTVHLSGCDTWHQRFDGEMANTQMRRGNFTLSPAGVPKSFQHRAGGEFMVVHVAPELLRQVAEQADHSPGSVELLNVFCGRDPQIERLAHQLREEYQADDMASAICAESIGYQLAVHLLRHYSTARTPSLQPSSKLTAAALRYAMDYIEANLASDLTLDEIARAVAMSTGHFSHAFRNSTGVPPHRYVVERRIETAKALLRDSDLPIGRVASSVGFSTLSHFCNMFKRAVGKSPRTFRSGG
jgi:AraC family transcriptional regulator